MVNYPATSSVAVQSARPFLNRILRVFTAAGDAGKVAIAEQFAHFAYNGEHSKEESLYPTSSEPSAHAVRKDLANLSRHMHRQGDEARTGIAQQCEALVLSVGGALSPLVGESSEDNTAPAADADGKVTLYIKDLQPTLANVFFVNWSVNGVKQVGWSGDRIRVTPGEYPIFIHAEVHSMDGRNIAISWTVPAVVTVMEASAATAYAKDDIKGLSKAALLQLLTGEKTLEELTASGE